MRRDAGTTRKAAKAKASPTRPEPPAATAGELFGRLDRITKLRVILQTINALVTRTTNAAGKRSMVCSAIEEHDQCLAAKFYLIDGMSTPEIFEAMEIGRRGISSRVFERWMGQVREEFGRRLNAEIFKAESAADVLAVRGDITALSTLMWSELAIKMIGFVRATEISEVDNNTRHLFLRFGEGLSDMAKTSADVRKAEAQTDKIRRQLRDEIDRAGKKGHGQISDAEVREIVDRALGLKPAAGEVAA